MKLSVLIAHREDPPGPRSRLWAYIEGLYARHLPDVELCVGTDDGIDPFHKTVALNRAAALATGDMFLINDSDTWVPTPQLRAAVERLEQDPSAWGRPWNVKIKLGQADTEEVLRNPSWNGEVAGIWDRGGRMENKNTYWAAPPTLFLREHWEMAGGMDERFRGWGKEDEAFALTLRVLVGRPKQVQGWAVHLWHPRLGKSGDDRWPGEERNDNNTLVREYASRVGSPQRMAALVAERRTADAVQ